MYVHNLVCECECTCVYMHVHVQVHVYTCMHAGCSIARERQISRENECSGLCRTKKLDRQTSLNRSVLKYLSLQTSSNWSELEYKPV